MKKFILSLFSIFFITAQVYCATGSLKVVNTTNTISFKFKFQEAGPGGKERGWYKKLESGKSREIELERTMSAPDVKDFWVKAYDKEDQFLGTFIFKKNINIKNNKTSKINLNWSLDKKLPIMYVYKPGTSEFDFEDFGEKSFSEDLVVYNETYEDIYVATYLEQGGEAELVGNVIQIDAEEGRSLKPLPLKGMHSRKLFFSYIKEDLKKVMKGRNYENATKIGIGVGQGDEFYIAEKDYVLNGYTKIGWKIVRPLIDVLSRPFDQFTDWVKKNLANGPYKDKVATVSFGPELSKEETSFLLKRKKIAATALSKVLNKKIMPENAPIIACAHSGGGFRAMISSSGILSGLEKIGVLDSVSYLTGISGSTWCFTPFVYYQKSAKDYKSFLKKKVVKHILKTFVNMVQISGRIFVKQMFGEHLNFIDLYGGILGNKFFGQTKQYKDNNVHLSDLAEKLNDAKTPMPILTAISPLSPFLWFEYTPYYIGANMDDFYVPTWSFGREFLNGKSQDFAPEENIGFFMGIWGSAFAMKFVSMVKGLLKKLPEKIRDFIYKAMDVSQFDQQRLFPAKIKNPVLGVSTSSLRNMKLIELVDAGEDLSLPVPPLVRRKPNVIFFYDADGNQNAYGRSLFGMKQWAEKHGLKMPQFVEDEKNKKESQIKNELKEMILNNPVQIFEDSDPKVPTVIYFALLKNPKFNARFDPVKETADGFCGTFNFKYTEDQFDLLSGVMESHIVDNKDYIINAIAKKCEQLIVK